MSFREHLTKCSELALKTAENARTRSKIWYDKKARERKFYAGDLVLVLLSTLGKLFHSKYFGLYKVIRQVGPVDYLIATHEKCRTERICHVNMLKRYIVRHSDCTDDAMTAIHNQVVESAFDSDLGPSYSPSYNTSLNVQTFKLDNLPSSERTELESVLNEFKSCFDEKPGKTTLISHTISLHPGTRPIKLSPYRVNPPKAEAIKLNWITCWNSELLNQVIARGPLQLF